MAAVEATTLVPMVRCCGGCDGRHEDGSVEAMMQWQKVSDMLIAASVLSIPLELLYFANREALAPLRRAFLQLGTFVVLCGVTHLLNVLAYDRPGSRRVLAALTVAKLLAALSAAAAAASLPVFFPRALRVKLREDLLRSKARRLEHDLAAIRWREGTVWPVVRALADRVCDADDACAVRRAAVLQLVDAFGLRNCAIWTPTPTNGVLQLAHQLVPPDNGAHRQVFESTTISVSDPDVAEVMSSKEGKVLRPGSAFGMASAGDQPPAGAAAAIRLPILRVSKIFDQQSNNGNTSPDLMSYAILVLVLPPANTDDHPGSSVPAGGWSTQDLEVVQAVADQVAVALSHADALEESQLIRHKLAEQQAALLQAKREVASATKARNAAHAVMCDAMCRPTHPVVALLSVMQQEAKLRPDQRLVVDALARTGALSSTLMDDIRESVSAADSPPLSSPCLLARRPFELRALVRNVASVAGCLSGCRGIGFSHGLENGSSLPEWVVGDDRRVFHLLIHMVDALLSRCHQPHVAGRALSFSACSCNDIIGDDQHLTPPGRRNFSGGGNHVFVKFQVGLTRAKESGGPSKPPRNRCSGRANTQINNATCNKIAQMMNGNLWSASEPEAGLGERETMTLVLRFQLQQLPSPHTPGSSTYRIPQHNFNGLRILLADSDAVSLEVTRKLLERLGCQVVPVSSGLCCLSLLGSAGEPSFQLVVLDLHAGVNRFDVALRIRELSNSCWLLVLVALAGNGSVRDMCRRARVNGVIQKPITLPALGTELQRVLQNN